MKTESLKYIALFALVTMTACGGTTINTSPDDRPTGEDVVDGGTGGDDTTGGDETTGGEDLGDDVSDATTADLLSFVLEGTSTANPKNSSLTRYTRSGTLDGENVTVTLDKLPDGTNGLIQYIKGDDVAIYTFDDGLVGTTTIPDGVYSGSFDVSYSTDGGDTWFVGTGSASVEIDTTEGKVYFGGMATDYLDGDNFNSVEYYATADLVNGAFEADNANVVYRENGYTVDTFEGSIEGFGTEAGVVGLVGNTDEDFQSQGGFTLGATD
jgi:hypothetical protein